MVNFMLCSFSTHKKKICKINIAREEKRIQGRWDQHHRGTRQSLDVSLVFRLLSLPSLLGYTVIFRVRARPLERNFWYVWDTNHRRPYVCSCGVGTSLRDKVGIGMVLSGSLPLSLAVWGVAWLPLCLSVLASTSKMPSPGRLPWLPCLKEHPSSPPPCLIFIVPPDTSCVYICLLPVSPTRVLTPQGQGIFVLSPLGPWSLKQCLAHDRYLIQICWDFPGGAVVKIPSCNAWDNVDSVPGQAARTPHAAGQLSPCITTTPKLETLGPCNDPACCS